jgi:hypothetical protein
MSADTARALAGGDVQPARAVERLGLPIDEPENDVAIALAGLAHGPQKVEGGRLDMDDAVGRPDDGWATEARPRGASSGWRHKRR